MEDKDLLNRLAGEICYDYLSVQCHIVTTMVIHGPTLHCDKYYLNMEINHGQRWLAIFQRRIVTNIGSI